MAYVTVSSFNTQLAKIGAVTQFTNPDTTLDAKNLEKITGNLTKFDFVDFMQALSYKRPEVTLTSSLATLIYEIGVTVHGGQTLTAAVIEGSSPIVSIEFFKNGSSVSVITTGTAGGGNFTYASGTDITMNEVYKVVVTCADGETVEDELSVNFYHPYYYGVTANKLDIITQADITSLTKDVGSQGDKTCAYTSNNQYCVFAYPKSYGLLASVLDANGFQNIDSMLYREVMINTVPYYVYQTNTLVVCMDFPYTFIY